MSVVPMKMLTLAGPGDAIDHVICTSLVNQQFHPVEAEGILSKNTHMVPLSWNNPWQEPLSMVQKLMEQMEIPFAFADFRQEALDLDTARERLGALNGQFRQFADTRQQLERRISENTHEVEDLQRFAGLPSNLSEIYHLGYVRFRFGRMLREAFDSLSVKIEDNPEIILYPTQLGQDYVYLCYVTPKSCAGKSDRLMDSLGFERMRLTEHVAGTPEDTAVMLEADTNASREKLSRNQAAYDSWKQQATGELLLLYSYLKFMYGAGEIKKYAVMTEDQTFLLCGWAPVSAVAEIQKSLEPFPDVMLAQDDPASVKEQTPPVLLKNNFWARLFQPFTEMYGLPAYNEFDPTFLMAVTYSILFGLMYGDVGQGLVLVGLGIFLYKVKDMWLGGILGSVGVFSTLFGFVFGSFFGYEHLIPGFHVLESGANATRILIVSAAMGAVIITMMMVINITNGIRQKDIKKIFFTNNSLAGIIFYLAVVIGAVVMLTTGAKVFRPAYILVFIVLPLLVMFCQEPLGKLAAKKKDWKPESIGGFIAENIFEMFEVILSFVTNTVSFLRVGAYAICHAGMMLVVYTLAGSPASPVVLVIGNILVMGIEGLMVCIQVLRLDFYEMFGRFYESGSRPFSPAVIDYTKKTDF